MPGQPKKQTSLSSKVAAEKRRLANMSANASSELSMEDVIAQVLEKQQSALESIVHNAVKGALQEINTSLQLIRTELERQGSTVHDLVQQVGDNQRKSGEIRKVVNACVEDQKKFELKLAEMEDRSRRNNVRIIGIKEGREADDPVGFLQRQLPLWIPKLHNKPVIEIDRAHRIHGKHTASRTMIFRCLRYQDRHTILQGAREAQRKGPIRDEQAILRFKPDYSAFTIQRRQEFVGAQRKLHARGISNFLIYPATLRVTYRGKQLTFNTAKEADGFCEDLEVDASNAASETTMHLALQRSDEPEMELAVEEAPQQDELYEH